MTFSPRLVRIEWRDTAGHPDTWTHRKKVKPEERRVSSVGWVAHDGDITLVLAADWDASLGNFHGISSYPRGCIDSLTYLD